MRARLNGAPAKATSGLMDMHDTTDADGVDDPERALLHRYVQGDAAAARLLTLQLTPRIFGHAFRILGNAAEAEDVTQDALMRLWKIAPDWRDGEAKVTTWLYRVTANLCTDRLRKRGRGVPLEDIAEPADPAESAEATRTTSLASVASMVVVNGRQETGSPTEIDG